MRTWTIVKDIIFLVLGLILLTRGSFIAVILGGAILGWYGYNLYVLLRAMKLEKERDRMQSQKTDRPETKPQDGGKISISNTDDIKEVPFEKE